MYSSDGPYERETVITTSDGDELVTIETWQRPYLTRLRRDSGFTEQPGGDDTHGVFTIPATDGPNRRRETNRQPHRRTESRRGRTA